MENIALPLPARKLSYALYTPCVEMLRRVDRWLEKWLNYSLPCEVETDKVEKPTISTCSVWAKEKALRILLVEDEPIVQIVHENMLKKGGHIVTVAKNAAETCAYFQEGTYDVILTDIGLPDINGIELAKKIRHLNEKGATIPIIAITAYTNQAMKEECLNAGMHAILTKPTSLPIIEQAFQHALV